MDRDLALMQAERDESVIGDGLLRVAVGLEAMVDMWGDLLTARFPTPG